MAIEDGEGIGLLRQIVALGLLAGEIPDDREGQERLVGELSGSALQRVGLISPALLGPLVSTGYRSQLESLIGADAEATRSAASSHVCGGGDKPPWAAC